MGAPIVGAIGANASGTGTSVNIGAPASVVSGSVVLAAMFLDGAAQTVTPPAGWSAVENCPVNVSGGSHGLQAFWHRASGAEAGPYAFTWGSSTFQDSFAVRFDTVLSSGTPFDSATGAAQDNTNGATSPAVSTTSLGVDRLDVWLSTNWAGGTWIAPLTYTKQRESTEGVLVMATLTQAVAGSTGSVSGTCTGSDKRTAFIGALIGTTAAGAPSLIVPARRNRHLYVR